MAGKTYSADLEQLRADLQQTPQYSRTQEEREQQAQNSVASQYNAQRLAAQQSQQTQDLALANQLTALQSTYDKQRRESASQYRQAYSQTDRQALSRGMQRSSYNAQTLSNVQLQGARAQQQINDDQALQETGVESQRTLLSQQLAQQLQQMDVNEALDVAKRIDELEQQDYERGTAQAQYQDQLLMQIYQYMNSEENQATANEQWLKQFDEGIRQYDANLAEQIRQYDKTFAENKRQFERLHPKKMQTKTVYVPDKPEDSSSEDSSPDADPENPYGGMDAALSGDAKTLVGEMIDKRTAAQKAADAEKAAKAAKIEKAANAAAKRAAVQADADRKKAFQSAISPLNMLRPSASTPTLKSPAGTVFPRK